MTREEKIKLAISKGFTYDKISGKIYGIYNKEIKTKKSDYINIQIGYDGKQYHLLGHHFAFYKVYDKVVDYLDHIDGNRSNNKIDNLREVTHQENHFNRVSAKGYTFDSKRNKFEAQISLNKEVTYLGSFNTENEARQAYLDAKKIYHKIKDNYGDV